jgi:YHS domain-containing protein
MKHFLPYTITLLAVLSLTFAGCGSNSSEPASSSDSPATTGDAGRGQNHQANSDDTGHMEDDAAHMDMGGGQSDGKEMTDMDKMKTELAKLPPEDRASAEKQHMCPVSGRMLGTMGAPYKVEINGQQVWLCCPGCEGELRESPDEFLAKLPK